MHKVSHDFKWVMSNAKDKKQQQNNLLKNVHLRKIRLGTFQAYLPTPNWHYNFYYFSQTL